VKRCRTDKNAANADTFRMVQDFYRQQIGLEPPPRL
jgi:hypothetical protein